MRIFLNLLKNISLKNSSRKEVRDPEKFLKRARRFQFSSQKSIKRQKNRELRNAKSKLKESILNEIKFSKANSRLADNFSDREIYSESDLDHVEISADFDFYCKEYIIKHNISDHEPDPDTSNDPDYVPYVEKVYVKKKDRQQNCYYDRYGKQLYKMYNRYQY